MSKIQLKYTIAGNPTCTRASTLQINSSPDGSKIIYPSGNNIIIRDVEDSNDAKVFAEHGKKTYVARYSPNGNWVASGDETGRVKIWSVNQEDELVMKTKYEYYKVAGPIKDVAWCPENKRIVCVGDAKQNPAASFMWDTGSKLGDMVGICKRLNSCDIRPGRPFKTVVGGDDFSSIFYNGPPVKFVQTNKDFDAYVTSVRFSPNGDLYAASSCNGKIILYNGKEGNNAVELDGKHGGGCYDVAWSADSNELVSASADKTVKLWDVGSGKESASIRVGNDLEHQQLGIVWTSQGQIISVSFDGTLNYIDEKSGQVIRSVAGHVNSISSVSSKNGEVLVGSGFTGAVFNYDESYSAQRLNKLKEHKGAIKSVHHTNDGFLSLGIDNKIRFGNEDYFEDSDPIELSSKPECSDSANNLTVVGQVNKISIYNGNNLLDEAEYEYTPISVTVNNQGVVVASGNNEESIARWDLINDKLVASKDVPRVNGGANVVAFDPSGQYLGAGDNRDKAVNIFDIADFSKPKQTNYPHSSKVLKMEWSPDGKYLASTELSGNLAIWDTTTKNKKKMIKRHAHRCSYIGALAWSDENTLISGGHDGNLKVWNCTL